MASPFENVPNELMAKIFGPLCAAPPFREKPDANYVSPLTLGHVCHRWRELAWALPELWKYVPFEVQEDHDEQLGLFEDWLDRSKAQPLSIAISITEEFKQLFVDDNPDKFPSEIFEVMGLHWERWEALDIIIPNEECLKSMNSLRKLLPLLRLISIQSYLNHTNLAFLEYQTDLTDLFLKTTSENEGLKIPRQATDYSSLTRLVAMNVNLRIVYSILGQSPNIQYCRFTNVGEEWESMGPPLSLPHLETIIINTCNARRTLRIFGETPQLRDFRFSGLGCPKISTIKECLQRSNCKLQHLHLALDYSMKAKELISLLHHVSNSLVYLSLHNHNHICHNLVGEILDRVGSSMPNSSNQASSPSSNAQSVLLPKMRYFEYYSDFGGQNSPGKRVAQMLQRQWDALASREEDPKTLLAHFGVLMPQDLVTLLGREIREGLEVHFDIECEDRPWETF